MGLLMDFFINMGLLMEFFINMGFINSDSPFINDAKMIYQLPYLYICINGRGLSHKKCTSKTVTPVVHRKCTSEVHLKIYIWLIKNEHLKKIPRWYIGSAALEEKPFLLLLYGLGCLGAACAAHKF